VPSGVGAFVAAQRLLGVLEPPQCAAQAEEGFGGLLLTKAASKLLLAVNH
jgi:hypothetical protein